MDVKRELDYLFLLTGSIQLGIVLCRPGEYLRKELKERDGQTARIYLIEGQGARARKEVIYIGSANSQ